MSGGKTALKIPLVKLTEIKETLCLCNIQRIRNPIITRFTFRQSHSLGLIEQKLDFFLISDTLLKLVKNTDVLANCFSSRIKRYDPSGEGSLKV